MSFTEIRRRLCSVCGNDVFDILDGVDSQHLDLRDFEHDYYIDDNEEDN